MRELNHLADIFRNYDTFVIDLRGVMHNGVTLNSKAIDSWSIKKKFKKNSFFIHALGRVLAINFLLKMKMDKKYLEFVMIPVKQQCMQ